MDSILNSFLNQKETYSLPCPKYWRICTYCVVPENIHTPPPTEEIGFPGGGGGGAVTIGKYFQRVLVTRKRVTKKKHKNLPRQFICEDIKHDKSQRATTPID